MADGEPESLTDGRVTVSLAQGCFRRVSWEVRLEQAVSSWPAFRAALVAAGYLDHSRLPALWELELPGGHRLIAVPATGRLQLRLHYLSEPEGRPALALSLASTLAGLVPTSA